MLSYRWATSLHAVYDAGSWGVIGDLIYGDNGDSDMTGNPNRQGDFWGVVVMPYYWIVDDQLQLVGQYQYAAAEESEGIRVNSRYGRADGTGDRIHHVDDAVVPGGRAGAMVTWFSVLLARPVLFYSLLKNQGLKMQQDLEEQTGLTRTRSCDAIARTGGSGIRLGQLTRTRSCDAIAAQAFAEQTILAGSDFSDCRGFACECQS